MQTNRSAGAFPVQQSASPQSASPRVRLASAAWGRLALAASLAVGAVVGVGCGSSTPPAAKPTSSTVDVMQMRQHYQEMTPDARVGTVDAVRGEYHWVAISDPQWEKYKEGDGVSVLVGDKQYVTGTVQKIQGTIVIAKYDSPSEGVRAPEKGDIAIYIPPEGPGKGKASSASTPSAPSAGGAPSAPTTPAMPAAPAAPAMPDATATPATPAAPAPGAPAVPAPPEVPAAPAVPAAPTPPPEVPAAPASPAPPATPPAAPGTPEVPAAPAPAPGTPAAPPTEVPASPAPAVPAAPAPEVPAAPAAPAPAVPAPETPAPGTTPLPAPAPGESK